PQWLHLRTEERNRGPSGAKRGGGSDVRCCRRDSGHPGVGQVSTAIDNRQSRMILWRENLAGVGSRSHASAAREATGLFGAELSGAQARPVGEAWHFGVKASLGSLYGAVRPHRPAHASFRGIAFGAVVWLLGNEGGKVAPGSHRGRRPSPGRHTRG